MIAVRLTKAQSGVTLVECTVAVAICALFLSSLFVLNTSAMETLRLARETACASQILQQRIESLRIANWHQVTDATWLQSNLLNVDAPGASELKNLTETVTLTPYGSSSTSYTQLNRVNGQASIVTNNTSLLLENAVEVVWTANYTIAPSDRPVSRRVVAILAKGGVAKW